MSKIIYDSPTIQVIEHRAGTDGVLIGPPDAGHGDGILDYGPGQSIINEALENTAGGVHHIKWKSATQETKNNSIRDKVVDTKIAMHVSGSHHLIGLCQAGWLFAKVATDFPEQVSSLTVAGAPIDTSLGESVLSKAQEMPIEYYRWLVACNGGLMPGWLMNLCWKSANPKMHYFDRYISPSEKTDRFYAWYDDVQNLAGGWYLEIMEELFINNTFKDTLNIKCPVHIAVGLKDDITPPVQTYAIDEYCHTSVNYYDCDAGHLGVFTARKSMPMWADIFKSISAWNTQ